LHDWKRANEAARSDRQALQQFVELVFPGDEGVTELFERPSLGGDAFDMLHNKWVALEDLHNQSIASINVMAREQVMSRARDHEAVLAAKQEAESRIEELREQLTSLARDKAQTLTQKLQGGSSSVTELPPGVGVDVKTAVTAEGYDDKSREASEAAAAERERQLRDALDARQAETQRLQRELDRFREEEEQSRAAARRQLDEKEQLHDQLQSLW